MTTAVEITPTVTHDLVPLRIAEKWGTWQYHDLWYENWDAQPACIITDYVLAIEGFVLFYLMLRQPHVRPGTQRVNVWYAVYFVTLALSALVGGILHTYAYEMYMALAEWDASKPIQMIRLFGMHAEWTREQVDVLIRIIWRVVLVTFLSNSFAVIGLAASRYHSERCARQFLGFFAALYGLLTVYAIVTINPITFLFGYLPVMFFGTPNLVMKWKTKHTMNESDQRVLQYDVAIYVALFSCCASQVLAISPSDEYFNHNSFAHVILGIAAWLLYKQCVHLNAPKKSL